MAGRARQAGAATNLRLLSDGFLDDANVAAGLRGARRTFRARAGDCLFIPPGWPHFVENEQGGSVAWGVNLITPASRGFLSLLRDSPPRALELPLRARAVLAAHYLPSDMSDGAVAAAAASAAAAAAAATDGDGGAPRAAAAAARRCGDGGGEKGRGVGAMANGEASSLA